MPALSIPGVDTRATHLTTFTVKVDGAALPGTISVVSIDILREINRVPLATLVLHDGDAAKQDFEISTGNLIVPGKSIQIDGGYGSQQTTLFQGVVTAQRIKVKRSGVSLLRIEARDVVFRMTIDRKSAYFSALTDSGLFDQIIGTYQGITAQVNPTTTMYAEIVQHQVSDWDFIVSRAERASLICVADNGTLKIGQPKLGQTPAVTLTYGSNVYDLDLDLDARTQFQEVSAHAWDQANQQVITAQVTDTPAPPQGNLSGATLAQVASSAFQLRHSGSLQQPEVAAWAQAAMLKSRFSRIRGTVRFQGNDTVKPGGFVDLQGMGARFNGPAFVSGIRHTLGSGDWETAVQLGLPPEWHHERFPIEAPRGAGLHVAMNGLHVGVVTQLQGDPDGQDRIRVRIPLINANDAGIWSRLATLDAGQQRGSVFRPEINDEVIVGFINDDPHAPVVLGMLHSSSHPAPLPANDNNHDKGLITRSGMKIIFHDDKPSLSVETPNGNKVEIDDSKKQIVVTDQSGNTAKFDPQGIALDSPKRIVLKASGDISIEGMNVSVKANASATVAGSSGATVTSSGTTVVKGSLVQIN